MIRDLVVEKSWEWNMDGMPSTQGKEKEEWSSSYRLGCMYSSGSVDYKTPKLDDPFLPFFLSFSKYILTLAAERAIAQKTLSVSFFGRAHESRKPDRIIFSKSRKKWSKYEIVIVFFFKNMSKSLYLVGPEFEDTFLLFITHLKINQSPLIFNS